MTGLDELRTAWLATLDGESGHALGEALEDEGLIDEANEVYERLIADGYLIGYADMSWLEHSRGNQRRAEDLLEQYLDADTEPDEQTALVAGLLGRWRWQLEGRLDAEPLLRAGSESDPGARADLGLMLRSIHRDEEAEEVLRAGVDAGEQESFLPLGNLLWESNRSEEAESVFADGFALGDTFCAYNLHLMLRELDRGAEADVWLQRGADGGDEKAIAAVRERPWEGMTGIEPA